MTQLQDLPVAEIHRYRIACEKFLLTDLVQAEAKSTEFRLWNIHGKINNRYRARLAKFRNAKGSRRVVERRKLESRYLAFIKSSMRFYRLYIQRLVTQFSGPKEVLQVAHSFHSDGKSLALIMGSQLIAQIFVPAPLVSRLSRRATSSSIPAMPP
jgi:hypothetical protein